MENYGLQTIESLWARRNPTKLFSLYHLIRQVSQSTLWASIQDSVYADLGLPRQEDPTLGLIDVVQRKAEQR